MVGGAGEDDPDKLIEEEADAAAEGRAVLGVEVCLVQGNEAKDPIVRGNAAWRRGGCRSRKALVANRGGR